MATSWYVKTNRSVRGPMSFQDVAFLIRDDQLPEEGLVRREDSSEWQIASSVVGLLRAARKHPGLQEDGLEDEVETIQEPKNEPYLTEREKILENTIRRYQSDTTPEIAPDDSRREFIQKLLVWGPLLLIGVAIGASVYAVSTHDQFASKNFEATE